MVGRTIDKQMAWTDLRGRPDWDQSGIREQKTRREEEKARQIAEDIIDFFEYGGDTGDILVWLLYTTTIFSILLLSGLYFTDSKFMESDSIRISSGIFIITISILNLISRLYDFQEEAKNHGIGEFWLDFLYWPSTHERLELVFLGIVIGFLIVKKRWLCVELKRNSPYRMTCN